MGVVVEYKGQPGRKRTLGASDIKASVGQDNPQKKVSERAAGHSGNQLKLAEVPADVWNRALGNRKRSR